MIRRAFVLIALLAICASSNGQSMGLQGAWRENSLKWMQPPAELELGYRYAEAVVLYFGPDHVFVLVYGTVNRSSQSEALSRGDSRVVYLGKWSQDGEMLDLEFRCVGRTVPKEGETLPGPIEARQAAVRKDIVLFENRRFLRDSRLDRDLQDEAKAAQIGYP